MLSPIVDHLLEPFYDILWATHTRYLASTAPQIQGIKELRHLLARAIIFLWWRLGDEQRKLL